MSSSPSTAQTPITPEIPDATNTTSNTVDHDAHEKTAPPTVSHEIAVDSARRSEDTVPAPSVAESLDEVSEAIWDNWATEPFRFSVLGMAQEDVWRLMRRFNHLVFRVTAIEQAPCQGLDANTYKPAQSSPEHLQAQMERFYMTVMVTMFAFWKHIARLRSWKEWRRTASFLFIYVMALVADQLGTAFLLVLIGLIISPAFRHMLFPFMPPSTINSETGGVQRLPNGMLGKGQSITGAPENYEGEVIELEAQSFFSSLSKLIAGTISDKPGADPSASDNPASSMAKLSQKIGKVKEDIKSCGPSSRQNRTERPMLDAMEEFQVLRLMGLLLDFVDTWERIGNAICPTPLFQSQHSQIRLVSLFIPFILISICFSRDTVFRSLEVLAGIAFFGEPLFREMRVLLDRRRPGWLEAINLRNTVLRNVPNDAQLAITILRAGEQNKAPLQPQPISQDSLEPMDSIDEISKQGDIDAELVEESAAPDNTPGLSMPAQPPPDRVQRFVGFVKRISKRGVKVVNKIDEMKAKDGNENAQQRLDLGQTTNSSDVMAGPIRFPACYEGSNGYIYVSTSEKKPSVRWKRSGQDSEDGWVVQVDDIQNLSKVDGINSTHQKFIRGVLDKDVLDGIAITVKHGTTYHISKVVRRDVLFNRLIGLGNQIWELH